ncbi:MAG: hypothetical protein WCC22_07430 [Terriglobales bacterium]
MSSASSACRGTKADEVISVAGPDLFLGVSQWYHDYSQINDDDVRSLLDRNVGSVPRAA